MIYPEVGRRVHYYPEDGVGPYAAIVAHVWGPWMVNLAVFDKNGEHQSRTSVELVQPEDPRPSGRQFCTWMPFQVEKK